jgi:hypothetical protein
MVTIKDVSGSTGIHSSDHAQGLGVSIRGRRRRDVAQQSPLLYPLAFHI